MRNKKAFTVVELVIVIAIIAILAAVLIPTFANIIKKANTSKDNQLIRNLNTALAASRAENNNEPHANMTEALAAAEKFGYEVDKINASGTDAEILWDSQNDLFCYFDGSEIKYIPESELIYTKNNTDPEKQIFDVDYWVIRKDVTDTGADNRGEGEHQISATYSTYLAGLAGTDATIVITKGLDVGNNVISAIKYNDTTDQKVTIRTNGGELIVDAKDGTVKHYGNADSVNIVRIATSSYHEFGTVPFIQISEGRLEIEAGADVNGIHVANVQVYNESTGEYDKTEKTFSSKVTLTLNGANVKLSRDPISLNLSEAVLVCEVQADANSASEFIWLVGNGTLDDAKVVVTPTNVYDASKTVTPTTASNAAKAIANYLDGTDVKDGGKTADEAKAASALKGTGTQADPFLIYDYATMQKISDFYYKGYYYFEVALDKTDNGKIDCSNWVPVYLNGSFNGKGVTFIGLDSTLFDSAWNSSLGNFTVKNAVVRQSSGSIVLGSCHRSTVHDVVVEGGYVEGSDRCAIFVGWGDATDNNFMEIKNCYSNATIVSGTSTSAAFVGHPYSDDGAHETTVIIDNCYYTGKIYNTDDTSPYFVAQSDNTVKVYLRNMNGLESYYAVSGVNGMTSFDPNHTHTDANNETYYCQTNYDVKYTGEHGKIDVKKLTCAQNQGELVSITGANVSSSASYAKIEFLIAPNAASTESGSYQSVYVLEENVEVVNGSISASKIYNCAIQINGSATTATGYNSNKTVFNIVNTHYGKTHNGATVKFTEYDTNGNIVQIVNVTIAKSNSVAVRVNGSSVKSAAVGLEYVYDFGQDLSNYDVSVGFVTLKGWSWSFTNNFHEVVEENYFTIEGSRVIIHNIEKKSCGEYDGNDYQPYTCQIGIKITEKSN